MENNEIIYSWSFSDDKNRSPLWYIIAISIVIAISFWGIISGQYALSLVIILAAGILFFVENNSEKVININITNLGIKIGEIFYDFGKIDSFSFVYSKENAIFLRIFLIKRGLKVVNLRIDNKICQDLKNILPNFLKENENSELSVSEKIINILKL